MVSLEVRHEVSTRPRNPTTRAPPHGNRHHVPQRRHSVQFTTGPSKDGQTGGRTDGLALPQWPRLGLGSRTALGHEGSVFLPQKLSRSYQGGRAGGRRAPRPQRVKGCQLGSGSCGRRWRPPHSCSQSERIFVPRSQQRLLFLEEEPNQLSVPLTWADQTRESEAVGAAPPPRWPSRTGPPPLPPPPHPRAP